MEMTLELILEMILELTMELTGEQAEIGEQDGCPLTASASLPLWQT